MVVTTRSRGTSKGEPTTRKGSSTREAQPSAIGMTNHRGASTKTVVTKQQQQPASRKTQRKAKHNKGNLTRNGQGSTKKAKKPSGEEEEDVAKLIVDAARQRCINANRPFYLTQDEQYKLVHNVHRYVDKNCWPKPEDRATAPFAPVESCIAAHNYYEAAGPKVEEGAKCTVLLMSESPAATDPDMVGATINHPRASELGHLNLMYSLSYGEAHLLDDQDAFNSLPDTIKKGIKSGTWKYWRLMAALAGRFDIGEDGVDPLSGDQDAFDSRVAMIFCASAAERVEEKANILDTLKENGILLIDCCVSPLYWTQEIIQVKGYNTPKNPFYKAKIVRESWKHYTQYLVEHFAPQKFVVLGKLAGNSIGDKRFHDVMKACGGTYAGSMYHPSSRQLQPKAKHIEDLRYYRELGQYAAAAAGV